MRSYSGGEEGVSCEEERRVDRRTARQQQQQQQRGNDALFCIREKRRRGEGWEGRWRCLQMWQLWWKERRTTEDKRWRREEEEERGSGGCVCIIHPCWHIRISDSSGEGHQSSHNLSLCLHSYAHTETQTHDGHTRTRIIANDLLVNYGSGSLWRESTDSDWPLQNKVIAEFPSLSVIYLNGNINDLPA